MLNQWVTSFFRWNLQFKFQVRSLKRDGLTANARGPSLECTRLTALSPEKYANDYRRTACAIPPRFRQTGRHSGRHLWTATGKLDGRS